MSSDFLPHIPNVLNSVSNVPLLNVGVPDGPELQFRLHAAAYLVHALCVLAKSRGP